MLRNLWCVLSALVLLVNAAGCELQTEDDIDSIELKLTVCADGPTIEGIDVSKWQATIDWDAVATSEVEFAFIRVSDGLSYPDGKFAVNWAEAKRIGLVRGAYQYFRPGQDPIAQADLLLEAMGPLEDGDLPPVLDVESSDGQSAAVIVDRMQQWIDHVEAATGTKPIIYTAKYFWQDSVGAPDEFLAHSLWVANYGPECPLIADPWPRWDFWQYTSSGSVPGIAGNVDRNEFNGTTADLMTLTVTVATCGDGVCEGDETAASCPADCDDGGGGGGDDDDGGSGDRGGDYDVDVRDDGDGYGSGDDGGDSMVAGGCAVGGAVDGGAGSAAVAWLLAIGLVVRRRR